MDIPRQCRHRGRDRAVIPPVTGLSYYSRQSIRVIRDRAFGSHATVHSGHTRQSWMQGSISRGTEYICVHYSGYRFAQSCGAVACLHPCRLPVRQENGFAPRPPHFTPCLLDGIYISEYTYNQREVWIKFEWDENKNKANKRKHGVTFELAVRVYLDDKRIEKLDMEHTTLEEERIHVIGRVSGMLILFVVAT